MLVRTHGKNAKHLVFSTAGPCRGKGSGGRDRCSENKSENQN